MARVSRTLATLAALLFLLGVIPVAAGPIGAASAAGADEVRVIGLATSDLVYDQATQTIFASVPSRAGAAGNSIAPIDPSTGAIGSTVFVGSEPGKLAISDDGQHIYVSLDGAAAVRRFDVASRTAGPQFALGSDSFFGPYYVEDMAVMPGNPGVVAVSRKNLGISPRHAGVAVYDNGVQRPNSTPRHTGSNVIEYSSSPTRLYGYNNETTEFGFRRMSVDQSGVAVVDVTPDLISGFGVDIAHDGGRVYASTGQVVDAEARVLVGRFSDPGISYGALVRPDSRVGRTFFLTNSGATRKLLAFDSSTFTLIGSVDVSGVVGTPTSLIRWGSDGLAFRTSADQVFLIRTSLVPSIPTAHVGDLDGSARTVKNVWTATVTVVVHDASHRPVPGALVQGNWGEGYVGSASCTTAADGRCAVTSGSIPKKKSSATWTVTGVSVGDWAYDATANHDPEGDGDGTVITVRRPS